jgi:biotin carboxylase
VAVLHHATSFFPPDLAQQLGDAIEVLWVVVDSTQLDRTAERLLHRLGPVVDLTGLGTDEAAALLAEYRPDGIVSFVDDHLELAAALAELLGLRYHTPAVAHTLADKCLQRAALDRAGVAGPAFWPLPAGLGPDELTTLAATITYPAVLKPAAGSGSRGIVHVRSADELLAAVAGGAGQVDHLVEAYLPNLPDPPEGEDERWFAGYLSVESVVSGGRISHVALTGRFPLAEPFRETGNFIPAILDEALQPTVLGLATASLLALGIEDAVTHTEVKLTPDGPKVIEVNGRLGGRPPFVLRSVSEINLFVVACQVAAGIPFALDGLAPCDGVGFWLMFQPPMAARRLVAVDGLAEVSALPGVTSASLNKSAGEEVDWQRGTYARVATVSGRVADHRALATTVAAIRSTLTFEYEA